MNADNLFIYTILPAGVYRIEEDFYVDTPYIARAITAKHCALSNTGRLNVCKGFTWDGPSGPAVDTANTMRGSCVHDCLYGLIEDGKLNRPNDRRIADNMYKTIMKADGVRWFRRQYQFYGVHVFGGVRMTIKGWFNRG